MEFEPAIVTDEHSIKINSENFENLKYLSNIDKNKFLLKSKIFGKINSFDYNELILLDKAVEEIFNKKIIKAKDNIEDMGYNEIRDASKSFVINKDNKFCHLKRNNDDEIFLNKEDEEFIKNTFKEFINNNERGEVNKN